MIEFAAAFLAVPDPGPGQAPPGVAGEGFLTILSWVKWIGLGVVVGGLIVIGARFAIQSQRGEGFEAAGGLVKALIGAVVIAAAVSLVSFLAT